MKKIVTVLLSICCLTGFAQLKQIAEGPKFEEPETGFIRVIQAKNGNTIYFHLTPNDGINLRVYDAAHKEKISTSFDAGFERAKLAKRETASMWPNRNEENIEAIFEWNNELAVFITEYEKGKTDSYRLTIDLATGKLKESKSILSRKGNYIRAFYIKRDKVTGMYIIKDKDDIIGYDASHREIFRRSYATGRDEFYMKDVVIADNNRLFGIFGEVEKNYASTLYLATVKKGSDDMVYTKLITPPGLIYSSHRMISKYNPVTKKIVFLVIGETVTKRGDGDYVPMLVIIDPETLQMESIRSFLPNEALQAQYKERYDIKKEYEGLPQDLLINKDGSISVVYEEMANQSTSSGNYTRHDARLGKMIVVNLDKDGRFMANYLVPKVHWYIFSRLNIFYRNELKEQAVELWRGNQFKSYTYLNSPKGQYILFNDTERNDEVKRDKFAEIQGITGCDAYAYKFAPGELFPKRESLFGKPAKGNIMAMFLASDYDEESNIYVTVKLAKESARDNTVNLVWLQPQ